jgi:hypothetical protein
MVGVIFTVMVKVTGVPLQPFAFGVTVTVEVKGPVVVLVPTKEAMFPVPLAPNPVAVLLFVQLNVAPAEPEKVIAVVLSPAQIL